MRAAWGLYLLQNNCVSESSRAAALCFCSCRSKLRARRCKLLLCLAHTHLLACHTLRV